ncbi:MAG: peptide synthase, partial [Victivallales bacterium]
RVWFCGRKAHRVVTQKKTYYSVCCEAIFNHHPKVARTAIVGVGEASLRRPVLIVETIPGELPCDEKSRTEFIRELAVLGEKNELTNDIKDFLFHPSFPVDIRHNAKIFREKLAVWADDELKQKPL